MRIAQQKFGRVFKPNLNSSLVVHNNSLRVIDFPGNQSLTRRIIKKERELHKHALKTNNNGILVFYDEIILN